MPSPLDPAVRLKRLEALADLWGKIYLFHPAIVSGRVQSPFSATESGDSPVIDLNQALVRAIPRVEAAETPEDLAKAVNEELLQPLEDPLTFATANRDQGIERSRDRVAEGKLEARRLTDSVGYVRVPSPSSRGPEFLTDFQAAVETLGNVEKLVVDLRWPVALGYRMIDPVLQFFVRTRLLMSPVMKRVHVGWNEDNSQSAYQQKWEVSAGARLHPIQEAEWFVTALSPGTDFTQLKTIATPTVFLVNRPFATRYYKVLDALQSQPGIAVVFEPSGPPVAEPPFRLEYPEGLAVQLNTELLVGHDGNAGFCPDLVVDKAIVQAQLAVVAEQALLEAASPKPQAASRKSAAALLDLRLPAPLSEGRESLTREERLLGLFKVWSVVRYLDPHLELCDIDWQSCLPEWIPQAEAADSLLAYVRTLRMLTAHLHDNNVFYFFPNLPEPQALPVFFGWVEGKVIVTDIIGRSQKPEASSQKAEVETDGRPEDSTAVSGQPSAVGPIGLEVGDELVEFDGKTVSELVADHRMQVSYSTEGSFCQRMCDMLVFGPPGSEVKLVVRRRRDMTETRSGISDRVPSPDQATLTLKRTVTREARVGHSARRREASGYQVLDGNIGYMDLGRLSGLGEFERAFEALRQTRGLIVDVRRYPGFTVQAALSARLSDRPVKSAIYEIPIVSGYDRQEQVWNIGQYEVQPDSKALYSGPVVVLVNEKTFGGAEDICIFLKNAERVTFVGGTTAGCNGNRTWLSLPGGGRLWFTGMRVKFGNGSRFQNIGITPDVPVAPTVEGIRARTDEVLEKGLEVLRHLVHRPSTSAPGQTKDEQTRDEGQGDQGRRR
jgi:C-terminal processing protease CtpA/Prc